MRPTIRTLGGAVFASATAFAVAFANGVACSEPDSITGSGSSSGSTTVSTASDTVGAGPEMSSYLPRGPLRPPDHRVLAAGGLYRPARPGPCRPPRPGLCSFNPWLIGGDGHI